MVNRIRIINKQAYTSVFFFRAQSNLEGIWLDDSLTQNIVGNSEYDCSGGKTYNCQAKSINTTLFFTINSNNYIELYIKDSQTIIGSIIWSVPIQYLKDVGLTEFPLGPYKQSQFEFTMINNTINYDSSFVEGINCGVDYKHYELNKPTNIYNNIIATPAAGINNTNYSGKTSYAGMPTIISDKHRFENDTTNFSTITVDNSSGEPGNTTYSYDYDDMASCPLPGGDSEADAVIKLNRCRSFYYQLDNNEGTFTGTTDISYCKWLRTENVQGYCWAFDEWICKDENCGYQDPTKIGEYTGNIPFLQLSDLQTTAYISPTDDKVPSYACGYNKLNPVNPLDVGLPSSPFWKQNYTGQGSGDKWWTENIDVVGCTDNIVNGKGISLADPNVTNFGLDITFNELPFITGQPYPSGNPILQPLYDPKNDSIYRIIIISAGIILGLIIDGFIIKFYKRKILAFLISFVVLIVTSSIGIILAYTLIK